MPTGADAVVQIEDTRLVSHEPACVHITRAAQPGEDVRQVGSDVRQGELVLPAGTHLGPAEVGILATVGATHVKVRALANSPGSRVYAQVRRTPVVAVLSTGDEVLNPGDALQPGKIRDANRPMLLAAAVDAGADVLDLGIARDDAGALEAALDDAIARGADVLLTTGGVSMGDKDLVKGLLESRGEVFFGKARVLLQCCPSAQPHHRS